MMGDLNDNKLTFSKNVEREWKNAWVSDWYGDKAEKDKLLIPCSYSFKRASVVHANEFFCIFRRIDIFNVNFSQLSIYQNCLARHGPLINGLLYGFLFHCVCFYFFYTNSHAVYFFFREFTKILDWLTIESLNFRLWKYWMNIVLN